MKGLGGMMKQAQQLQEKMQQAQEEIAGMHVVGESGAGMVKITMTGRHDARRVEIDDSLMSDDKEILEDLIAAAINDAVRKVESETQSRMSSVTAGLPIPPGFKMPF